MLRTFRIPQQPYPSYQTVTQITY